ncbi:MAG: hypothetical protein ACRC5T_06605 [Cetobacterium sp.]
MYFVVETKGSVFEDDLRETEKLKIQCGKEHFKVLEKGIGFEVATSFESFIQKI